MNKEDQRQDVTYLWIGIIFSFIFTLIIWVTGPMLNSIENTFVADKGASWYFWQLPNPTLFTRIVAWSTYLAHQFLIWGIIYYAQNNIRKYSTSLHQLNFAALGVNAIFVLISGVRTHTTYDGLAQDTSVFSSQGSVIILLVFILIIENNRRGMFFGKKAPLKQEIVRFLKKYHGYYFAWAIIYTWHFHPMADSLGHLWGFFYTMLLLLQGSLFYTRIHTNRAWIVVQEIIVLIHGTLVAYLTQGSSIWTMFFFGFLAMFLVTQIYGLGLSKQIRWVIFGVAIIIALVVYSGIIYTITGNELWNKTWIDLNEVIRIPIILYGLVFLLIPLLWFPLWIATKLQPEM